MSVKFILDFICLLTFCFLTSVYFFYLCLYSSFLHSIFLLLLFSARELNWVCRVFEIILQKKKVRKTKFKGHKNQKTKVT